MPWCNHPDCNHTKLVHTEGSMPYCATRNKAIRDQEEEDAKPAKVYKPLKRSVAPIAKVSDKRYEQGVEYSNLSYRWLAGKERCSCCGEKAELEVHHMKGRANNLLLETQYWLAVCRPCHEHITEDSVWAIKEGYSLPRNSTS